MRKLKSIKQLLEEFPDAYFDSFGNLVFDTVNVIPRESFKFFGKELTEKIFKDWDWDEQWFEPIQEKKLYAFKQLRATNVVYTTDEEEIGNWKRCPEFDLTFKD